MYASTLVLKAGAQCGSPARWDLCGGPLERVVPTAIFSEDPHVVGTALYDEIVELGYGQSYSSFTRNLRQRELRPKCLSCLGVKSRYTIEINHPPGEEIQFDFTEFPSSPLGPKTSVLVGTLAFSSKARCQIVESQSRGHLIHAIHAICLKLGGTARIWRFDNMAAIRDVYGKQINEVILQAAKYYGVEVVTCGAYSPQRKGVVEKFNHYLAQRWWRTAQLDNHINAQESLDRFCIKVADKRRRPAERLLSIGITPELDSRDRYITPTVAELGLYEKLKAIPAKPFPTTVEVKRIVSQSSLVAYLGNYYSVPLGHLGKQLTIIHHISTDTIDISTKDVGIIATHTLMHPGSKLIKRSDEHRRELERSIFSKGVPRRPHHKKANIAISERSKLEAEALRSNAGDNSIVGYLIQCLILSKQSTTT